METTPEGAAKAQEKGTGMKDSEFYANATLGFRQWYLSLGTGTELPLLEGLVKLGWDRSRYRWDPGSPNHARCPLLELNPDLSRGHGEVPGKECSCGFYAYDRRDDSNSETTAHLVGGLIAGWGNLELHERGFRCSTAKILALFEPDQNKRHADYDGVAQEKWEALRRMCARSAIPLLPPEALRTDEEVRRYAGERELVLLEDQLSFRELSWPTLEALEEGEGLAS
jgi:hypothetical protein